MTLVVLLCAFVEGSVALCETHRHRVDACPTYITPEFTRPGWRIVNWKCVKQDEDTV